MSTFTNPAAGFLSRLTDLQDAFGPELFPVSAVWNWRGFGQPILGTQGGDLLAPPPGDDTSGFLILGLGGDDALRGGPRSDTIAGGSGNDGITAGFGDDTVDGGSGDDVISGHGGSGLTPGQTIGFWEQDGSDTLDGGGGADTITAYGGDDLLRGGSGDDVLTGGIGADTLVGGSGADTFRFGFLAPVQSRYTPDSGVGEGHRDVVQDFRSGEDKMLRPRLLVLAGCGIIA